MSYTAEAADQVVRMSLEGGEVVIRLLGSGAKHLAIMLFAMARGEARQSGEARLMSMLKSGKERKVFALKDSDLEAFRKDMLIQIEYFQHERLIHLIVTITFALATFITLGIAVSGVTQAYILLLLLVILLAPYIKHYYLLENGVQKMYTYYDALVEEENRRRHEAEGKSE